MKLIPSRSLPVLRAVCLSAIYAFLIAIISNQITTWITATATPSVANPDAVKRLGETGRLFVYLNTLTFGATLVWLAQSREFSPLGRYLIPTILGAALTFIAGIAILIVEGTIPGPIPLLPATARLVYWLDTIVPGILAGQLFRFPRSNRTRRFEIESTGAPSNTR